MLETGIPASSCASLPASLAVASSMRTCRQVRLKSRSCGCCGLPPRRCRPRLRRELEAYRGFVVHLGEVAAGATRSGGVFGVGGQRVSYAEASTLARIRQAV